jgi:polyferredoxin
MLLLVGRVFCSWLLAFPVFEIRVTASLHSKKQTAAARVRRTAINVVDVSDK